MKDKSTSLLLLVVLGIAVWYFIDTHQAKTSENRAADLREQQRDAAIAAIASKYNAVTNLEAKLPNQGLGPQLSIDVSRALVGDDKQSVLFICILDDIRNEDGKNFAELIPLEPPIIHTLTLACSPEQATTLDSATGKPVFAVIARCHQVKRTSDDDETFVATGEMLDVLCLP